MAFHIVSKKWRVGKLTTTVDIFDFNTEWTQGIFGKKILVEGDSWVSHPFVLNLSEQIDMFNLKNDLILNIASPGDEARKIFDVSGAQYKKIQRLISSEAWGEKFDLIFISAAGNDIIGEELWKNGYILNKKDYPNKYGEELITHNFYQRVNEIVEGYDRFLIYKNTTRNISTPVITHSYCYLKPRKVGTHIGKIEFNQGWVCIHLEHQNITDSVEQYLILRKMLDYFFNEIKKLESRHNSFIIVDIRELLFSNGEPDTSFWYDEIHPNSEGFKIIADHIKKEVKLQGLWTL